MTYMKLSRTFPAIGVIPVAQHVQMRLVDDLDGSKAVETITIQVDSKEYEIDLNEEHAARLRDALALYVAAGRRANAREMSGSGLSPGHSSTVTLGEVGLVGGPL